MGDLGAEVSAVLRESVRECVEGRDVAVAFSGGLDSSLAAALSKEYARSLRLYVAGTEGSWDVEAARSAAGIIGAELAVAEISPDTLIGELGDSMSVTGTTSPLILAFEFPLYKVMKACAEGDVIGGQGADELFVGYAKYRGADPAFLAPRRREDLRRLKRDVLPHEAALAANFGKTMHHPYLREDLERLVMSAPLGEIDPANDAGKPVLRAVAEELGYGALAKRPKKAAQYGSGLMDAINGICRERGVKYNALISSLLVPRTEH